MSFTIYIDESGDAGISKIASPQSGGSSPYFVLGAVVCQPTAEIHAKNAISLARETFGKKKWKHATQLGHFERVFLARELGRLPVRYFAVVSNKHTLGDYGSDIEWDPHKFYNKCIVYLLEIICSYLNNVVSSENDLRVVLERRNHNYDRLIRYVAKVRDKPLYEQSRALRLLNPFSITAQSKGSSELLDVADFVSNAVYQCSNSTESNYGIPEPRYFNEICSRFAGDQNGKALGVGLKCIHSLEDLRLEPEIERLFKNATVQLPSIKP